MIKITLPDGSQRKCQEGVTPYQIAEEISTRLAQDVLAAEVDGKIVDLSTPLMQDANVKLLKWEDDGGKHAYWHTSAHLMAEAIQALYPHAQFGIGPAIENGFYYDIDTGDTVLKESDLAKIEEKMLEFAKEKQPLTRCSISKQEALKCFANEGQTYKVELINDLEDGTITTYSQGSFTDLCRKITQCSRGILARR